MIRATILTPWARDEDVAHARTARRDQAIFRRCPPVDGRHDPVHGVRDRQHPLERSAEDRIAPPSDGGDAQVGRPSERSENIATEVIKKHL
jgi:hypothetical protein